MAPMMLIGLTAVLPAQQLPAWEFDSPAEAKAWVANSHFTDVFQRDGVLHARAIDWDPFFNCRGISIKANPWQYVLLRIKADQPGIGELFWSGELRGKYGGLTPAKSTRFNVPDGDAWHDIVVLPFWHTEGTIRQLRLDLYNGARFEIDRIQIVQRSGWSAPQSDVYAWDFKGGDTRSWQIQPAARSLFAPPLRLAVADRGWVTVRLSSDTDGVARILWAVSDAPGLKSENFAVRGDGKLHTYHVEVDGVSAWHNDLVAFGIGLPGGKTSNVDLESIRIEREPTGPPELRTVYFGFENGVNRAGRPCRILAQFENDGAASPEGVRVRLHVPNGLRLIGGAAEQPVTPLNHGDYDRVVWEVSAQKPGEYAVQLDAQGPGAPQQQHTQLTFLPALDLPKADYVPAPRPVETDIDVCAYYFPGWQSDAKWMCIRDVAPIRKPLLGYYDEANPECVDWQIKWAAENGIRCFLVDWYWVQAHRQLEHWLEAYRKAKYRDQLKIALMWANHNPPNTHSRDDWRRVTQHWIDRYFSLKTYYHIDGKPAVFIWAPRNVRHDLGGTEAVREALAESQTMARNAGLPGITFVAMEHAFSSAHMQTLRQEGYVAATSYHEWGMAGQGLSGGDRLSYQEVVRTAEQAWEQKRRDAAPLAYYPVVDTGWDARPWHGERSFVIQGRTPDLFAQLLRKAKAFCESHSTKIVVLGPVNEWGEGSYIEPCTEFGFQMLECIRRVFAKGDPRTWPVNVAPSDVGLGPYGFPPRPTVTTWTFDQDAGGWAAMMGIADFTCRDGALRFRTASPDPALLVALEGVKASAFRQAAIRMQLVGQVPAASMGQLFWATGSRPATEATSVSFPLATDGQPHTYRLNLAANPRWRGRISTLRFDPCSTKGITVMLDQFELIP